MPEVPEYTQTLNDLLSTAANDWAPKDRLAIVTALRAQRELWNREQTIGSRKRVTSNQVGANGKKIEAGVAVRKGGKKLNLAGLKL
ncbi:MAG: hypothetical protein GY814_02930 [Gammaproteobacteria bacterium]|nr:hypothetical protein [Gammaproteobacteria bacterium]